MPCGAPCQAQDASKMLQSVPKTAQELQKRDGIGWSHKTDLLNVRWDQRDLPMGVSQTKFDAEASFGIGLLVANQRHHHHFYKTLTNHQNNCLLH